MDANRSLAIMQLSVSLPVGYIERALTLANVKLIDWMLRSHC